MSTATWSICVERRARPGETTETGHPADFVGWTLAYLPRYFAEVPEAFGALAQMIGLFQERVCGHLDCDVSELTWRGGLVLTDEEVAERIAGLPIPTEAVVVVARVTP